MDNPVTKHFDRNPTKTEMLEANWYEFLQFLNQDNEEATKRSNTAFTHHSLEYAFWWWFVDHKMEASSANPDA